MEHNANRYMAPARMYGKMVLGQLKEKVLGGSEPAQEVSQEEPLLEIPEEQLITPVPPEVIVDVEEIASNYLTDYEGEVYELLDDLQVWIQAQDVDSGTGNQFFNMLAEEFADPHSLHTPIYAEGKELFCIIGAEGWADIGDNIGNEGWTVSQTLSAQEAHRYYADYRGLTKYRDSVRVLCAEAPETSVLVKTLTLANVPEDEIDLDGTWFENVGTDIQVSKTASETEDGE